MLIWFLLHHGAHVVQVDEIARLKRTTLEPFLYTEAAPAPSASGPAPRTNNIPQQQADSTNDHDQPRVSTPTHNLICTMLMQSQPRGQKQRVLQTTNGAITRDNTMSSVASSPPAYTEFDRIVSLSHIIYSFHDKHYYTVYCATTTRPQQ